MKKSIIITITIIVAAALVAGYLVFSKQSFKPSAPAEQVTGEKVPIPGVDTNDYLEDALSDLEAVEGL